MNEKTVIRRLPTGVAGLDAILGGGLPEYSFNIIIGPPGSGKTTLVNQIMFSLATREKPALFFTVLGEPPLKMLRYQQQFSFFNPDKVNDTIRFVSLSEDIASGDYDRVLARIAQEVQVSPPGLVFVDSFRSVMYEARQLPRDTINLQQFIQQLGIQLSCWQATSFLIGEYSSESEYHPVFTVADGLLSLHQSVYRNSMVRKIQVLKMRGQATSPGMHTLSITSAGIAVYPTALVLDTIGGASSVAGKPCRRVRLATGVARLDEMLGGGLPSGYSLLVAGPSGSGKTVLATAFLAEGVRRGEPGVIVAFEQTPNQSCMRTLYDMICNGQVGLINTRSLDLSIDEIVYRLTELIQRMNAARVVIDSLSGFELAVAPTFREDFRESLFRMFTVLSKLGVTVLMTSELEDRYNDLRFSPYGAAFLTDAIIVQRYIEVGSRLQRVMAVVKVRASAHNKEIRRYEITDEGIVIGDPVLDYEGILGGQPSLIRTEDTIKGGKQQCA
ncbi:ATPase domain-containing protein [Desulfonatronum lacustre]|uniref:ATPase domain-containing protein n=1 Tax=Desulfonatronum lacustre TaxID=66849 RepID=UPI00048B5460|nr:ATPase domain-containing protein [Desulfonatronum lacustre]SMP66850.1 circadian clock protein KaiC [Desulfonatronum zhilinae]